MVKEYVFFFYDKDHLLWQMIIPSDDPFYDGEILMKKYNAANDFSEEEKAVSFTFSELKEWIECLRYRGKDYLDENKDE